MAAEKWKDNQMKECGKETILRTEGDAWFERNKEVIEQNGIHENVTAGCKLFCDILQNYSKYMDRGIRVLEIGCSFGYNLIYMDKKYSGEYLGLEPSAKAVEYGNYLADLYHANVSLVRGTADELPFEDSSFDIVMLGFCVYNFDRRLVYKTISEVDRVLKVNGLAAIWDFDTKIPFWRENAHNEYLATYKFDISRLFYDNPQYSLIEKRSFSHFGETFCADMQERCALNVLYKEKIETGYIFCKD